VGVLIKKAISAKRLSISCKIRRCVAANVLPTLTADQKKQFGPFVSDYAILYGYSQQVSQAMDSGLRPVVDSVNAIRVPQDYMTQREPLRQANGALGVLSQQLQNAKMQADALTRAETGGRSETGLRQVYSKVVTAPANALQPLIPARRLSRSNWCRWVILSLSRVRR
jgi:hypothetical protein